jgi:hypothetical protein
MRSQLVIQTPSLSETPEETMLTWLKIFEREIGVGLTLVRNDISSSSDALDGVHA